jgi:hypothetical protein
VPQITYLHATNWHCQMFDWWCILIALQDVCTTYKLDGLPQQINVILHHHMWQQQAPNHLRYCVYNLFMATPHLRTESKQPSLATDGIHSSKAETARTDDDIQGFEADNASKVRQEATPNHQAFVNTPHASQMFAYPGFMHSVDQKWAAALLKVMDNINAPDYAFGLILAWARGASAEEYYFHPQGGLDCAHNVTVLVKSIANATQLLRCVLSVSCPHGPLCDVVVFDFNPQLLRLLVQNPSLMIPENVVLDFQDHLNLTKVAMAF